MIVTHCYSLSLSLPFPPFLPPSLAHYIQRDVFGNILTSVVAIDAVSMGNNPEKQYKLDLILRELNKAYVGFQCQQDRGDTSMELLALSVKRSSSAFMGEFTECGPPYIPPVSQQSYLGNITLSQQVVNSEGSTPLSPIKELAESPRFTSEAEPVNKYGDFADKFTESLLGDIGIKKTSQAVTEAPPTNGNLDNLASTLSSSILEDAVPSRPKAVVKQGPPPSSSSAGVDELATALTSSIFSTSLPPAAANKEREDSSVEEKQPSSVDDFIGSLSSSILQGSLKTSAGQDNEAKPPPSSESAPPKMESKFPEQCTTLSAEAAAKSIIADALSLSSISPPAPTLASKISPPQTSGQTSDSTVPSSEVDTFVSLADQLSSSIISDVLSQPSSNVVLVSSPSVSSPPLNRPAIFIQVERRGSGGMAESPRSSRSSSLTGQTITLHEYTDELVESTCREGVAIALFQSQGEEAVTQKEEEEGGGATNEREGEGLPPPSSSSLDTFIDGVISTSIQDGLQETTVEVSPDGEGECQLASITSDANSSLATTPPRVVKQSPVLSRHGLAGRKYPTLGNDLGDSSSSDDGPQIPSKLLLSTPSSTRMSYAWSTASTRDEDSRPVSPTNLDRIALDLTCDSEEFSKLLSKIIVSEAIGSLTRRPGKGKEPVSPVDEDEDDQINNLPTTTKIDVFLSRLDQASPISEVDEGMTYDDDTDEGEGREVTSSEVTGAAYPSPWHKMRSMLLRPVATGNWGCGAFKGNPQLKSMIQWAATSAAGRPQMIYCTFDNAAVKQVGLV